MDSSGTKTKSKLHLLDGLIEEDPNSCGHTLRMVVFEEFDKQPHSKEWVSRLVYRTSSSSLPLQTQWSRVSQLSSKERWEELCQLLKDSGEFD